MTDREIITHLAEKVMGWPIVGFHEDDRKGDTYPRLVEQHGKPDGARDWFLIDFPREGRRWNPLEFIADAYEAEGVVLDGEKGREYLLRLYDAITAGAPVIGTTKLYRGLVHATPRQRCIAMCEATQDRVGTPTAAL